MAAGAGIQDGSEVKPLNRRAETLFESNSVFDAFVDFHPGGGIIAPSEPAPGDTQTVLEFRLEVLYMRQGLGWLGDPIIDVIRKRQRANPRWKRPAAPTN